ncbi:MAG: GNAT family N-acetyltransferase [Alistipes sp.]|nr:GNAT family N-acetyltransferase [Alistipes sp.]
MANVNITRLTSSNESAAAAISLLLKQLSPSCTPITEQQLALMVDNSATAIFLLQAHNSIIGMLTVGNYFSPTGRKAWIEDVVVDSSMRGKGYGAMLINHAIDYVRTLAPCTLMLTSNPSRIAANELYRTRGFEQKITNVYRMQL